MIVYADEKEVKRIGLLSSVEIEVPEIRLPMAVDNRRFSAVSDNCHHTQDKTQERYSNITYVKR